VSHRDRQVGDSRMTVSTIPQAQRVVRVLLIEDNEADADLIKDAFEDDIHEVVGTAYKARTGRRVGPSEFAAWKESLVYMAKVLSDRDIPEDSGVAIEYGIPGSGKRVDLIVSGFDETKAPAVVIVELKRWDKARRTGKDAIVRTRYSGAEQDVLHPSYQAWSYAALLTGFNEAVYDGGMLLRPCAYLHNYTADGEIDHGFYEHYIEQAPLFLKGEAERSKLKSFIKRYVRHGDKGSVVVQFDVLVFLQNHIELAAKTGSVLDLARGSLHVALLP